MKSLKMVFTLEAGANVTYTLQDPKEGLTMDEVRAVMQDMVTKQAILSGNNPVSGIKDAYLYEYSRQELA